MSVVRQVELNIGKVKTVSILSEFKLLSLILFLFSTGEFIMCVKQQQRNSNSLWLFLTARRSFRVVCSKSFQELIRNMLEASYLIGSVRGVAKDSQRYNCF